MDCELPGELDERERELLARLSAERLPVSVAIIMDGNGRWAQQRLRNRLFGHQSARTTVRTVVETARRLGLRALTLYAFSTENWKRSGPEVAGLMALLESTIADELPELHRNGVRVRHVGERERLPAGVVRALTEAETLTSANEGMTLALAINYGGRREILLAAAAAARAVADGTLAPESLLDETVFEGFLQTAGIPAPDLMIRTAGEQRISNFLLWELAYAELHFTDVLWPAFSRADFLEALVAYQGRDRRFGKA